MKVIFCLAFLIIGSITAQAPAIRTDLAPLTAIVEVDQNKSLIKFVKVWRFKDEGNTCYVLSDITYPKNASSIACVVDFKEIKQ